MAESSTSRSSRKNLSPKKRSVDKPSVSTSNKSAASLEPFDRGDVGRVALKAFFGLVEAWNLDRSEARTLLGNPSERTYYRWRDGQVSGLSDDTLERISLMLGIYKACHILLPVATRADAYIHRPNQDFGGESALAVMLKGRMDNLYQVRRYLDGLRG